MKKFAAIAVAVGLFLSVATGAQNKQPPEAMKKSSRSRGIWKFRSH